MQYDLIVIGGGAAGFFCAIQFMEQNPGARIVILEKSSQVLGKVRVSGGGRCNVTHACFDPAEMVLNYPRGEKELLGPFHRFLCGDMMGWLDDHGIPTKIESDGRVFPESNSSQTIIDCFLTLCEHHGIQILKRHGVTNLNIDQGNWEIHTESGRFESRFVMMATGSSPAIWNMLGSMGYAIIDPVPSLFTFNIRDSLLEGLPGISVPDAVVRICKTGYVSQGPLLITHWGLSGPAILKLSAWAARELHAADYTFKVEIDWCGEGRQHVLDALEQMRLKRGHAVVKITPIPGIPKRLWARMSDLNGIGNHNYGSLNKLQIDALTNCVSSSVLGVSGKSTFKEEFVTCGGVDTRAINFKTMESKRHPGLYFAGEVLNIDAVTGGFNFQAAWTEAFIAAVAMSQALSTAS